MEKWHFLTTLPRGEKIIRKLVHFDFQRNSLRHSFCQALSGEEKKTSTNWFFSFRHSRPGFFPPPFAQAVELKRVILIEFHCLTHTKKAQRRPRNRRIANWKCIGFIYTTYGLDLITTQRQFLLARAIRTAEDCVMQQINIKLITLLVIFNSYLRREWKTVVFQKENPKEISTSP